VDALLGADEDVEVDAIFARAIGARQVGDDLAVVLELALERLDADVDRHQIEARVHPVDTPTEAHVLAQSVLFVLREHAEDGVVEPRERIFADLGLGVGELREAIEERSDVDGVARVRIDDVLEQVVEQVGRLEQKIEGLLVERQLAEPQSVERGLEPMAEVDDLVDSGHCREPLERVHRTKRAVEQIGVVVVPAVDLPLDLPQLS
jgi:hypothetical protein